MNKKVLGIFAGVVGLASMASAATFNPCTDPAAINNVAVTLSAGSGNTAVCGAFTFSNFAVSVTGQNGASAQVNIAGSAFSDFTNGVANLTFQIGSIVGTIGDILMFYTVTGPLDQVDNVNHGTANPNVTIQENVYTMANCTIGGSFNYSNCANPTTQIITNGGGSAISPVFAVQQVSVISKDIQFHSIDNVNASISDFTNSHHTSTVPEPMTLSMMGLGLLGLGLARRRQQVKK